MIFRASLHSSVRNWTRALRAWYKRFLSAKAKLSEVYKRLVRAGERKLFHVSVSKRINADGEATVDGTHPTDLGENGGRD